LVGEAETLTLKGGGETRIMRKVEARQKGVSKNSGQFGGGGGPRGVRESIFIWEKGKMRKGGKRHVTGS